MSNTVGAPTLIPLHAAEEYVAVVFSRWHDRSRLSAAIPWPTVQVSYGGTPTGRLSPARNSSLLTLIELEPLDKYLKRLEAARR